MKIDNPLETLVGAAVLTVAIGFAVYAAQSAGGATGGDGYTLTASFGSVGSLSPGADVRLAGVKVGTVRSVALDAETFRAETTLEIAGGVEMPEDTSAKISSEGLLGGMFVALEPGGSDFTLAAGDEIELTQGPVDFLDLIGKAIHTVGGGGGGASSDAAQ